jgi:hypothetical protein
MSAVTHILDALARGEAQATDQLLPLVYAEAERWRSEALERLVQLYDATGKKAEAERWRKELEVSRAQAEKEASQKAPPKREE